MFDFIATIGLLPIEFGKSIFHSMKKVGGLNLREAQLPLNQIQFFKLQQIPVLQPPIISLRTFVRRKV